MFLLTSQFIKLLVQVDNLNSTSYPLQILCAFKSYKYTDAIRIILHVPVHKQNTYIYLI